MSLQMRLQKSKPVMLTPLGPVLTEDEKDLYAAHTPFGFCLFGHNCQDLDQVKTLCADLRSVAGDDVVIAIDQEGGRVARMREPHWSNFPAAADMLDVYGTYKQIGHMLKDHGITMDFAPCLDVVPQGGTCDAIGNRCFSPIPERAGERGAEATQALLEEGITPTIKHMPGHGRAEEDTHFFLPVVKASEEELLEDLKSFQAVMNYMATPHAAEGEVCGMTAHVIYECWDGDHPATLSPKIMKDIIRGVIGFEGILFSDDLAMKALDRYGSIPNRVQLCLEAGCDIALPCHTTLEDSRAILESL